MSGNQKLGKLLVTTRLLIILTMVAVGIALVFVFAIQGLRRTDQEVRHLANVEMEQLVTSTRLMQQSEMVASYARLVGQSNNQSEQRLNMMELTDRMLWLDKLVMELSIGNELPQLGGELLSAREALKTKVDQLSKMVFEPSVYGRSESRINALVQDSQARATELSLLASHVSADLRRQLNQRGRQLSQDVASQQERLNWLVTGLILVVIFAGLYVEASVSRRIMALQREVRKDEFGGIQGKPSENRGDEIDQLATAIASYKKHLDDHARAAQHAVRAKNRFLAGASHDLRQPVQALNLFLETLRGSGLTAAQANILEQARAASAASREMLDTLMDYSRIEAGVLDPKFQAVAVAPLLRRLEKEYGPQADAKGLVFRVRDSEDWVHTDQTLLFMLLRNLVSNALRYTEHGGVLIAVRKRRNQRCIEVWDTGIGIDAANHELIFQEFRQVEDNGLGSKGMGLGLAIVRELADMLNAKVGMASYLGRGSVFRVTLMADAQPANTPGMTANLWEEASESSYLPLPGLRVLVVDDEPLVRAGLCSMLEQWQCDVLGAGTVGQVQRQLSRAVEAGGPLWDVVLTDLRLSKTEDGGQVIRSVRDAVEQHPQWQQLPEFFILTGDTAPERLQMANRLGAALMHKPIDPHALHIRLSHEWLRRHQQPEFSPAPAAADPGHPG
ncbi:MAG: hybrid sensor histidine kinase/response regulator [Comamonas sp.]